MNNNVKNSIDNGIDNVNTRTFKTLMNEIKCGYYDIEKVLPNTFDESLNFDDIAFVIQWKKDFMTLFVGDKRNCSSPYEMDSKGQVAEKGLLCEGLWSRTLTKVLCNPEEIKKIENNDSVIKTFDFLCFTDMATSLGVSECLPFKKKYEYK